MSLHVVAVSEDPDDIDVQYIGGGALDVILNRCKFTVSGMQGLQRGSLQLTLLAADVDVITTGIGKIIAEESRKREP
jgi:hypothetical protein